MYANHIDFLDLLNGDVQYIVPRWQRRYRWGQSDIERLVDDLLTIAEAGPHAAHYGGTLLTFPEPGAAGVVKRYRVIDGQQRLTTVSILLACIAAKIGPEGHCGDWTRQHIRARLINAGQPLEKSRKLRLQDSDEDEYRYGLDGNPRGVGAVSQAWKIARRLVNRLDAELLLKGLERFRIVSIGLGNTEDPQQIFESLNATGRPLTESEKVKNWLLIGLPNAEQQYLHDEYWLDVERTLGAQHASEPIDIFLRDFLRWHTGEVIGIDKVYEGLRRWAVKQGYAKDRSSLCKELARLATLYGILTGTAGKHSNKKVERKLLHLREMGIDVHRPLTLRFLDEASKDGDTGLTNDDLEKVLGYIGTWITRLWLAERPTAGMNKAVAELAHGAGPSSVEGYAEYWLKRIRRFRHSRIGIPGDEEVREGIRTRKAYGSSATRSSFAVLCALMEAKHGEDEAPARRRLTIEHVMPQKLTDEWKQYLGDDAEDIHGRYRNRLGNLTLSGDITNPKLGTNVFDTKQEIYEKSAIGMTRDLVQEAVWNEEAIERRAEYITSLALSCWPWEDEGISENENQKHSKGLQWRIEEGPWRSESVASEMVMNVTAALLSQDSTNAEQLSGEAITRNIHLASRYPPGAMVGALLMHAVPGHDKYVVYPYGSLHTIADRCREMGKRCQVRIDVKFDEDYHFQRFWRFLKSHTGGVSGQKDNWRGGNQWTGTLNSNGDRIGIYVGNPELLWLYIRAGKAQGESLVERAKRMQEYSWTIHAEMSDQALAENLEESSSKGWSVSVQRRWERDDESEWPEVAQWLKEQHDRLKAILTE